MGVCLRFTAGILLTLGLTGVSVTAHAQLAEPRPYSQMDPHKIRSKGPWFEGWYTRINDSENNLSFAVVGASVLARGRTHEIGDPLPGYVAVLFSEGTDKETKVTEAFPDRTYLLSHGNALQADQTLDSPADFEWNSPGVGSITENTIDLRLGERLELAVEMRNRLPWTRTADSDWGPEGIVSLFKFIPLHWYVYSLGSEATYRFRSEAGQEWRGRGYAHQEKNWGRTFPQAWIWSQATSADNTTQLALTGGRIRVAGVELTKWLVGYRSPSLSVSFTPAQLLARYKPKFNACDGRFELLATNARYAMRVEATAKPSSFGAVSIPKEEGFVPGAIESFSTRVRVELYEIDAKGKRSRLPVETHIFKNAALEFGGEYRNCKR